MKLVKECQAQKVQNSDKCEVLEYPLGDRDIDMAIANLKGRYPDSGYCVNQECIVRLQCLARLLGIKNNIN